MTEKQFYGDFPTLQAKSDQLDNDISRINSEIVAMKANERYRDNPAEKEFQIAQLEEQKAKTLTAAESDFQIELEATELYLAEQTFQSIEATAEQHAQAATTTQAIKSQVLMANNSVDTLAMLAIRAKSLSDLEKQTLANELPSLLETALTKAVNDDMRRDINYNIDKVKAVITDTPRLQDIADQQEALKRIKLGGDSIRRKHDAWEKAQRNMGGLLR